MDVWTESVRALLPMLPSDVIDYICFLASHDMCAACGKPVLDRHRFVEMCPYYLDIETGSMRCHSCAAWRRFYFLRGRVERARYTS